MTNSDICSPSDYVERVSLTTGEVIEGEIKPEELLVQDHRDYHVVDTYSRVLMSRLAEATGDEERVNKAMKKARKVGKNTAGLMAKLTGSDPAKTAERLFGLKEKEFFFRYKNRWDESLDVKAEIEDLQKEAFAALERCKSQGQPQLTVLLTGGTGFVGKELMWQAAFLPEVVEMVVLIRPKTIRDRKTGEVIEVLQPSDRGEHLLKQLWLDRPGIREKFRFIAGDIEQPRFGISDEDYEELCRSVTNVIHCAASVAFDDPYDLSFRANVVGSRNALAFSKSIQDHPESRFVSHLSIETSYIHGRQSQQEAREDEVVFPRNYYNNYYELTKAMASLETEEAMLENSLRVVQLCPAIVIGDGRTGNNRGDAKVVNAPVNAFGRARQEVKARRGNLVEWSKAYMLSRMANVFPGDASAELNLIPVDWVAQGILKALTRPSAVGQRIHLATDSRITTKQIQTVLKEELRVKIKLAEPTWHRNFQLPLIASVLKELKQPKLARALNKLDSIFGGYSERGQPIHEVGNDVTVLDMPEQRPVTLEVFRMLCRHNKYVQGFGQVRDLDEVSRREKDWLDFIDELEDTHDQSVGSLSSKKFHYALKKHFNLETLEPYRYDKPQKRLLSKADAAWLHMDRPDNLMMITALFTFEEEMDFARFREVIEQRMVLPFDRFRMRVKRSRNPLRRPSWVPVKDFNLDNHLKRFTLGDGTQEELMKYVSAKMSQRLSRRRPLWEITMVDGLEEGGCAMVAVLHHAIADGIALMKVLMNLTDPVTERSTEVVRVQKERQLNVRPNRLVDLARKHLGATADLGSGLLRAEPKTPFKGPLSAKKKAAVSKPISLEDIKAARIPTSSTVNDILMTALTGGLRRYVLREQGEIAENTCIRAVVPVDLRRESDEELGNRFGLIFMELPIGIAETQDQLVEVKRRMDELKNSPQAVMVLGLLAAVGSIPAELEKQVVTMFGARATAVCTNVPGPKEALLLADNEITGMMFWVPQSGGLGLGLSILSYNGQVRVGIAADAGLVKKPELLVQDFEAAFEDLLQASKVAPV